MSRVYMNDKYQDLYNELANFSNKEILIYHTYLNIINCYGFFPEKAMSEDDVKIAKDVEYKLNLKKYSGRSVE